MLERVQAPELQNATQIMIIKLPRLIYKLIQVIGLRVNSVLQKSKLSLVCKIGSNFVAEGHIILSGVLGDIVIGNNVFLGRLVKLGAAKNANLQIGDYVSINQGTFIIAISSITIGNFCRIGEYVSIRDNDHEWKNPNIPIKDQGYRCKPVFIGDDVWIGRSACILKGVKIGNGAIIGAGAIVTKNVSPFEIVAGVPARTIGHRNPPQ